MNNIFSLKGHLTTLILSVTLLIGIFSFASPSLQIHASISKTQSEQLISRAAKKKKQIYFFYKEASYPSYDSNLQKRLILSLQKFNQEVEVQSHLNKRRTLSVSESNTYSHAIYQTGDRGDHIHDSISG